QKPYEKHSLKSVSVYDEGRLNVQYRLKRNGKSLAYGKKVVLDSVTPFYGPGAKRGPGWAFSYRDGDQLLTQIVTPSGAKERFEYRTLDLGSTQGAQEGNQLFRNAGDTVINLSNNGDGWRVEASCDDRFCYETLRN